jgi:hypothetical protein
MRIILGGGQENQEISRRLSGNPENTGEESILYSINGRNTVRISAEVCIWRLLPIGDVVGIL